MVCTLKYLSQASYPKQEIKLATTCRKSKWWRLKFL